MLALRVPPATEQDRAQVGALAEAVQQAMGENVEVAYVDRGYTGEEASEAAEAAEAAEAHGIRLEVVKHPGTKKGFVLLPRRWAVGGSSRGRRVCAGWRGGTRSGCRRPWRGCTSSPSRLPVFLHRAVTVLGSSP